MQGPKIDKIIFWTALIVIGALVIPLIIYPEASQERIGGLLSLGSLSQPQLTDPGFLASPIWDDGKAERHPALQRRLYPEREANE